uniref:Uncharacterized protein n=1 Tax=Rangifer tarandus platyrhynchus TaxID=3082113 RepID=A0ACB0E3I3_RANTA|nr:unnamed protein product [Rangifer tarandus platyrhynchus]
MERERSGRDDRWDPSPRAWGCRLGKRSRPAGPSWDASKPPKPAREHWGLGAQGDTEGTRDAWAENSPAAESGSAEAASLRCAPASPPVREPARLLPPPPSPFSSSFSSSFSRAPAATALPVPNPPGPTPRTAVRRQSYPLTSEPDAARDCKGGWYPGGASLGAVRSLGRKPPLPGRLAGLLPARALYLLRPLRPFESPLQSRQVLRTPLAWLSTGSWQPGADQV